MTFLAVAGLILWVQLLQRDLNAAIDALFFGLAIFIVLALLS